MDTEPTGTMFNGKSLSCMHLFYIHVFNILYFIVTRKVERVIKIQLNLSVKQDTTYKQWGNSSQ